MPSGMFTPLEDLGVLVAFEACTPPIALPKTAVSDYNYRKGTISSTRTSLSEETQLVFLFAGTNMNIEC
jgi:hypothetical protein